MVGLGGFFGYSSMGKRLGYVLPIGELGFKVISHWRMGGSLVTPRCGSEFMFFPLGKLVYGYSSSREMVIGYVLPAGEVGLWLLLFAGDGTFFPLGKLVLWSLPAGVEGGLHGTKYLFESIISVCLYCCV